MSEAALVFISCGQFAPEELSVARKLVEKINAIPGLEAYFAQNETSLDSLSKNILSRLARCRAFIAIMHRRGEVSFSAGGPKFKRASVWIEQEIAIASFRHHVLDEEILAIAYIQSGIKLEGLREHIHFNAIEFESEEDILKHFDSLAIPELVKLRGDDAKVGVASSQKRSSPLDPKPYPQISLEPQPINPDFIIGITVKPWSYSESAPVFDTVDVAALTLLATRFGMNAYELHSTPKNQGLLFASAPTNQTRSDGSPLQPSAQIFIARDGEITFRFTQNDGSPYEQMMTLCSQAYNLTIGVFDKLRLQKRAYFRVIANLHAGRQSFFPTVAGSVDERIEVDLSRPFSENFIELFGGILSTSGQPFSRATVREDLQRAEMATLTGPNEKQP